MDQLLTGALGKLSVTPLLGGRMKRWLLAGTLALAAGGQGLTSDPPPPPRAPAAYAPPVVAVYNWGGIYFGFNLGYGFGTSMEYLYMKLGNTTCTSPAACGSDLGLPGGSSNPNDTREILHQHDSARPRLQVPLT